jgi:hypothetical protein
MTRMPRVCRPRGVHDAGTIRKQRGGEVAEQAEDGKDGHKSVRAEVRCCISKEKSGRLQCRRGGGDTDAEDAEVPTEPQPAQPEEQPQVYSWRGIVDAARAAGGVHT